MPSAADRARRDAHAILAATALAGLAACAHAPPSVPAPTHADTWTFDATYSPGTLAIEADFPAGSIGTDVLVLDRGEALHVHDLHARSGDGESFTPARVGDGWRVDGCARAGCRLTYTFDLRASTAHDGGGGMASAFVTRGDSSIHSAPASRWLLQSTEYHDGTNYLLRVHLPLGQAFVSGLVPVGPDTYGGSADQLLRSPYSAFGPFVTRTFAPPGGRVTVAAPADFAPATADALFAWAERAIRGVTSYLGAFPVAHAVIIAIPAGTDGIYFGAARGHGGASVQVLVGPATRHQTFLADWVLVHEVAHFALPNLPSAQHWWEEGLATYLEILIRARLGLRTSAQAWDELIRKLPQGQTADGLNHTRSWANTYWGGALFCFLADVRIRERTGGAHSFADALRAINVAGGTIAADWTPQQLIEAGDAATGTTVLAELWRDLAEGHDPRVDLDAILRAVDRAAFTTPFAAAPIAGVDAAPIPAQQR